MASWDRLDVKWERKDRERGLSQRREQHDQKQRGEGWRGL